jgi:trimeric autotransporter adhesin
MLHSPVVMTSSHHRILYISDLAMQRVEYVQIVYLPCYLCLISVVSKMCDMSLRSGNGVISTVAGSQSEGYSGDEVLATSAALYYSNGIAIDASGNIYIADSFNNRIRMVTKSTGIITTVAGSGLEGYSGDGGLATSAGLYYPKGVAIDASGNIYIADTDNNRIRMVTKTTGIISTVAGSGLEGYSGDGGLATSAGLFCPNDVAIDASGNIYIADTDNNRIRLVTKSTGIITTVAGSGLEGYSGDGVLATSAALHYSNGVTIDASGNIYIADSSNNRIRMVTKSTGIISTVAGTGSYGYSGDGGLATSAGLFCPNGVALDASGNIYIADSFNHRIRMVTKSTGVISTVAGTGLEGYRGDGGLATSAGLFYPSGVTLDASGNIYIADSFNNRIRMFSLYLRDSAFHSPSSIVTAVPTYSLAPSSIVTSRPSMISSGTARIS